MSEPYTVSFTTRLLAGMSDEQLARTKPTAFRLWPARRPLADAIGRDLIAQERAKRANIARSAVE